MQAKRFDLMYQNDITICKYMLIDYHKSLLRIMNMQVLSDQALKYYQKNNIPKKMETILNLMFFEKPNDQYGFMVRFKVKCIIVNIF